MWDGLKGVFVTLGSYFIAITRLIFLDVLLLLSGLQQILYTRCEIVNIEMKAVPLRCDITKANENVSYIEKLCCENPDLVEISEEDSKLFGDDDDEC